MAIDTMEEIIMCEEKAKKIRENGKIFANQIYNEIVGSAEAEALKAEKEYKEKLSTEHTELKARHLTLLKECKIEAKKEADVLINSLIKHKATLSKSLADYILDKG